MELVLPAEHDYPSEMFRRDLPEELRVGCARAYFKLNFVARGIFRRRLAVAFSVLPSHGFERALDAGTGVGFLLPGLARVAKRVVAVDLFPVVRFAQAMLDKRGIGNVRLTRGDLLSLPFPDGTFDLIVCLSVIEHIPDPAAAFSELGRVLRPQGTAIVGYPMEHRAFHFFESLCRAHNRLRRSKPATLREDPHVSHYRRIEQSWDHVFRLDARRNVGAVGIPLYRILRLTRKS